MKFIVALTLVMVMLSCKMQENKSVPWVNLFDGKSLEGWSRVGGEAEYSVRDGAIVGTSTPNTPNTFLRTTDTYKDFILELEFKIDSSLNSGIQIRSNSIPTYQNGIVHGYQVEIDPSERAWSAGIYEEGRRGWLYPLTDHPAAQKAFKQNAWNHYRIEAIGDTIKTWINNVPAAHLIDDMTASGFIALQVHSIDRPEQDGKQVAWRNIRIITTDVLRHSRSGRGNFEF